MTLWPVSFVGLLLGALGIAAVVGIRRLGYGEIQVLRNGALLPLFDWIGAAADIRQARGLDAEDLG